MSKILFVGDVHLSDRPPIGRNEGYREQILAKLSEIGEISRKEKVDATVLLGDINHPKQPRRTSHYNVHLVQDIIVDYHGEVFINPGNHDYNPEGLPGLLKQPIAGLRYQATILGWTVDSVQRDGYTLIARPYDAKRDLDPSYYSLTEEEKLLPAPRIVVCHGSLVPRDDPLWGVEYHHYALPVDEVDTEGIDLLVSCHIHEPFGPLTLPVGAGGRGTTFLNPGSISRTSRKEINYTRAPKVVLYDTVEGVFTDIPLTSVLPAEEVFVAPEEAGGSVVTDEIRDFANSAAEGLSLEEVSLDKMLAGLDGVSDPAKAIIREELEEAGV